MFWLTLWEFYICFDHNLPTPSFSQIHLVFPPTFSPNLVFFFLVFPSRAIWYGGLPWDHGWLIQGYTVKENILIVSWELWTANTRHKQVAGGHFASNPSLHAGIWSGLVYRPWALCTNFWSKELWHYAPTHLQTRSTYLKGWAGTPAVPAVWRWRQENLEFQAVLGCIESCRLKTTDQPV